MRTFLCLTLLATVLHAQESFHDVDFDFSFSPPEGLVPLDEQELRGFMKIPDDFELNAPLTEDMTTDLVHKFYWRDGTDLGREIRLDIGYSPRGLPFIRPEDFADAVVAEGDLTIETKEPLKPPHPGFTLTGTAMRPDDVELRRLVAYFILGKNSYAFLTLTSPSSRWDENFGAFSAALDSVTFPPPSDVTGSAGGGGATNRSKPLEGSQAAPGSAEAAEKWGSLEVTGSLVLAMVLLMGLFAGGKRSS